MSPKLLEQHVQCRIEINKKQCIQRINWINFYFLILFIYLRISESVNVHTNTLIPMYTKDIRSLRADI